MELHDGELNLTDCSETLLQRDYFRELHDYEAHCYNTLPPFFEKAYARLEVPIIRFLALGCTCSCVTCSGTYKFAIHYERGVCRVFRAKCSR